MSLDELFQHVAICKRIWSRKNNQALLISMFPHVVEENRRAILKELGVIEGIQEEETEEIPTLTLEETQEYMSGSR